jgi:hypothetical protein
MTAAVKYLTDITDQYFAVLMCRAARRICASQRLPHRAA